MQAWNSMWSIFLSIYLVLKINYTFSSDYNEFLDDLEEDAEMRQRVNIYKDSRKQQQIAVDENDMDDPSAPHITLEEMLDDLVLDDVEMKDA